MKIQPEKVLLSGILLFIIMVLTVACGRTEGGSETKGEDYIYSSSKISFPDNVNNLQIEGEYLYYIRYMEGEAAVCRLPAGSVLDGKPVKDFSGQEILAALSYTPFRMPEGETEIQDMDFSVLLDRKESGEESAGEEERYCWLYLTEYFFDGERNLYYNANVLTGRMQDRETAGILLSKQTAEGDTVYRKYLPEVEDFAADFEGRCYVLTGNDIMILDREGEQAGSIAVGRYKKEGNISSGKLISDGEGRVFCLFPDGKEGEECFEIAEYKNASGEGRFELREEGTFPEGRYYRTSEGNVLINSDRDNILYEYDRVNGTMKALLRWGESNMTGYYVESVAGFTSDSLLVNYSFSGDAGVYRLVRTKRAEIPEKERLILVSLNPSPALERAVAGFNARSNACTIVIEDYGAYYSESEGGWQTARLDAELVSAAPPDLLDLHLLDISKYADQGVLEDLGDYLEKSSVLDRADFLDNILEGMTIDGSLICLPKDFEISYAAGRASQIDPAGSWTMESLYELTGRYPGSGSGAINDGYGAGVKREYLLEEFCSAFYLEKFVDWENHSCSFDSGEFGSLLLWVKEHGEEQDSGEHSGSRGVLYPEAVPEEALLVVQSYISVFSRVYLDLLCGEETIMTGFPTPDGKGRFRGSVSGGLGIVSHSGHKDAAWEFLEYYFSESTDFGVTGGLPSNRAKLAELFEDAKVSEYEDPENGGSGEREIKSHYYLGEERVPVYGISPEQAEAVMEVIEKADFAPLSEGEQRIIHVVAEEAEMYFQGDATLDDTVRKIQNRVQLYLDERN